MFIHDPRGLDLHAIPKRGFSVTFRGEPTAPSNSCRKFRVVQVVQMSIGGTVDNRTYGDIRPSDALASNSSRFPFVALQLATCGGKPSCGAGYAYNNVTGECTGAPNS